MVKKVLWVVFVMVVFFAAFKLLPDDLNKTMVKVNEIGMGVGGFVEKQSERIKPEEWPELPNLLEQSLPPVPAEETPALPAPQPEPPPAG